ncbi:hypothetical protein LENED_012001 [Lentinula edodes]|uniref:Uncharacterized protein n=1 Tax=Lentinula edodes TaxID=5353 RepID=A0A1Q3ERH8_LENED|nr:hypothetical protein LENED_012001 [Lentinula edodes]
MQWLFRVYLGWFRTRQTIKCDDDLSSQTPSVSELSTVIRVPDCCCVFGDLMCRYDLDMHYLPLQQRIVGIGILQPEQ